MFQSKHIEFIILTLSLLITRGIDARLTYLITPDLSREQNPLVKFFGMGWEGMLGIGVIVILAMIYFLYWTVYKNVDNFPTIKMTLTEYQKFYFDTKNNPNYKTNQGLKILAYVFSYSLPRATIIWGLFIILHNSLVYFEVPFYQAIRASVNVVFFYYLLLPAIGFWFINRFVKLEYTRFQTSQESVSP
ncbi:MAG: hypothetical protein ACK40V_00720 [Anaerolineales bacterium]